MATYRKPPVSFDIPRNSGKQGYSFVPFTGLEINENPVLNTQSSASDMLNMVVDENYFLTLRPRLIEDDEYNKARERVLLDPDVVDHIVDSLVLRQGLYLFNVKHTFAIDPNALSTVVVEGERMVIYSNEESFQNDFDNYVISRDGDVFRFVSKVDDDPEMIILQRGEDGWTLSVDEPHIPTYRGIITQNVNLLEQPVFEDLNILTTKYKLSVLYDENNFVAINDFYPSAEVIEGAPYFVDVSVAGLDEEEGVRVYATDLIFSKLKRGHNPPPARNWAYWALEIYNGTDHNIDVSGVGPATYYGIRAGTMVDDEDIVYLRTLYKKYFPLQDAIIERNKAWIIHNNYDLWYENRATNILNGAALLYLEWDDFPYDLSTDSISLISFRLRYGSVIGLRVVDTITHRIPALPYDSFIERRPTVLTGDVDDDVYFNPSDNQSWLLTEGVVSWNMDGFGTHDMIEYVYGDGSFLGAGQKAICYESASYSLYYDYGLVQTEMFKDNIGSFVDFSFDIFKVDHVTKTISTFATFNVVSYGGELDNYINIVDFRRLWNKEIVYDANSNVVYTLHYDAKSNKFIRANFKQFVDGPESDPAGGDNSIGTKRGKNMEYPVGMETPEEREGKYWITRFNDIVYYVPESAGAHYYNNMDLNIDNSFLDMDTHTYSNTNYLRNYYFDGALVTVHSGTWGQGRGNQTTTAGGIRNLGLAMVVTDLTTLETIGVIGSDVGMVAPRRNHVTGIGDVSSVCATTYDIRPKQCVYTLNVDTNNDFIKGVIYNDNTFVILTSVELKGVFVNQGSSGTSYDYLPNKTYLYNITNNVIDLDNVVDMSSYFGAQGALLGGSREIGIRSIGAQTLVCNYTEDGLISSSTPLFYIMPIMLNASKTIDIVGTKLTSDHDLLNVNIENSGNIRLVIRTKEGESETKLALINLDETLSTGRLIHNILDIAESMNITATSELLTGGFMVFSLHDGYYYYGPLRVNKNEIIFTYDLNNNTRNVLRLDDDVLADYFNKRKEWVENTHTPTGDKTLLGASEMLDSRVYYKRNYLFLTYPSKPNYIPLINVVKTKRTVKSATSYLQQMGVVYEENNVEYLQIAENPFVTTNYLMHTYVPRLTSVEQPAIDYLENKHLLTFVGLTVYLNEDGLFGLNFNADTPQDDQRKATLLSKVVNKKLLKYDLNTAFLANYDPYVLILIPQEEDTHVFAYKIAENQWFFWKLPIVVTRIDGDNLKSRFHYGENKVAMFTDEPVVVETDITEYHGSVEKYMDFDTTPISWFWKSQILALGSITKRKQITDTYFIFVNNNANVVLDEENNFDIVERRVTTQGFGLRYLTFKDTVDIAPRVEYEQELNIINNLRKRTYLNRFNYCQLLCYNIDNDNPIQDKVRIANIVITYKFLTGGR